MSECIVRHISVEYIPSEDKFGLFFYYSDDWYDADLIESGTSDEMMALRHKLSGCVDMEYHSVIEMMGGSND